ncbi:MAG: NAD-dependent epimerase/dehydratase family protein [Bacteroidota bacterium]|nr:NAD-dependent epimerase/dehydratase family protein [Bacteroidota bacterium]
MQTILGAGGSIGTELAKELVKYTDKIRLVSRNPKKVNETDELFPADLTAPLPIDRAIEGSDVVYVTIGFKYDSKVWQEKWPSFMKLVIASCKRHQARLVFFDNVYMYDRDFLSPMTEETPIRPTSKKGEVRAQVADMLLSEIKRGQLKAVIARSADFIGSRNSFLTEMVYKNLAKRRSAYWLSHLDKVHNFTDTSDAARATALLGNTPEAFGQVWHLPTSKTPITGRQWVDLVADKLGVPSKAKVFPNWQLSLVGIFVPVLKEMKEMMYQYDRDYLFDSSKFEKQFNYQPVTPEEAVDRLISAFRKK